MIRGTDQHFAIVVGDFGYEFVPHNANLAGRVLLKQFCKDVGAVFLAPPSADADYIYQINDNGQIAETPTDDLEGLRSRSANSKGVVGQIRKPVEQIHGALFQCWCICSFFLFIIIYFLISSSLANKSTSFLAS